MACGCIDGHEQTYAQNKKMSKNNFIIFLLVAANVVNHVMS